MDYTTLTRLKLEKSVKEVTDDTLLSILITTASRDIDRYCTGTPGPASDNYFQTATITNEVLTGWLDSDGNLVFYLHKPAVSAVTAFSYKLSFNLNYVPLDATALASLVEVNGGPIITVYAALAQMSSYVSWGSYVRSVNPPSRIWATVTYSGGLGATTADLPGDLVEACTENAIRLYMENKAGLADAIGSVDTGIMTYTKAMPIRIQRMLEPYKRNVPWRAY